MVESALSSKRTPSSVKKVPPKGWLLLFPVHHFVFPESMLKTMLPVGSGVFMKLAFQAARKHPKECRSTRLDIDQRVRNAVAEWKSRKRDG